MGGLMGRRAALCLVVAVLMAADGAAQPTPQLQTLIGAGPVVAVPFILPYETPVQLRITHYLDVNVL